VKSRISRTCWFAFFGGSGPILLCHAPLNAWTHGEWRVLHLVEMRQCGFDRCGGNYCFDRATTVSARSSHVTDSKE